MIQTKEKEINGRKWSVTEFAGTTNLLVLNKLGTLLAATAAHGIAAGSGGVRLDANVDFGKAIDALLMRLGTSEEFVDLIKLLVSMSRVEGEALHDKAAFDRAFAGSRVLDLLPGLRFIIEANYGDFSQAAAGIMSLFRGAVAARTVPPQASNQE